MGMGYRAGFTGQVEVSDFAGLAQGDLLMGTSAGSAQAVAGVATGNALISGGVLGDFSWGKIALTTHVSGTLPVANGGTGLASYAVGDLLYASGATTLSKLADVAVGRVLVSGGVTVAPAYSATPTLGVVSATTGSLTFCHAGAAFSTTLQASSGTAASITYVLPTNKGTAGQVLYDAAGDGVLGWTTVSSAPAFSAITAGTNTAALVVGSGGTLAVSGTGTIAATTVTGFTPTAAKTLTLTDSTTIGTNAITFAGGEVVTFTASNALTFTTTGSTNVTLPTSGTLLASGGAGSFTTVAASGAITQTTANILTAQTVGLELANSTAADVSNTVQNSGALKLSGAAWKSTATAASQANYGLIQFIPITGTTATRGKFSFFTSTAGSAPASIMELWSTSSTIALVAGSGGIGTSSAQSAYFGWNAGLSNQSGDNNAAYGAYSMGSATSLHSSVAVGRASGFNATSAQYMVWLGKDAGYNLGPGQLATATHGIAIGYGAVTTANNQGTLGSNGGTTAWFIGYGAPTIASPATTTINFTGGSGADNAGASGVIAAGISTGAAAAATIAFQTGTILGTGGTAQTLATRLTIGGGALTTGIAPLTIAESHIIQTQATAPTSTLTSTTLNDGAGSGAAIAITAGSTDNAGSFTITAGNGVPSAGIAGQIVFAAAFGSAPKTVQITAADTAGFARFIYINSIGTTSFQVLADVAFVSASVHKYYYTVIG